ncbi:MAG: rhomboid family intramembrane serine protease [Candidatus Wallbacteria bacterium]|nr:rhomboid family intramembrane serine protease [Candidatus Wallbacteria bacterium]
MTAEKVFPKQPEDSNRSICCPHCRTVLETKRLKGINVDICTECGGTWYDEGELRAVLGRQFKYENLLKTLQVTGKGVICPCCGVDTALLRFQSAGTTLEIDHCLDCRGFWLDRDELDILNSLEPVFERAGPLRPARVPSFVHENLSALEHYRSVDINKGVADAKISKELYIFCLLLQLPVEVFNPRRYYPVLLAAIIAVNVLVNLAVSGMDPETAASVIRTFGAVPARLLSAHGLISLVTYAFLHGGWWHLFANMYFLWIFGDNVLDVFMDHDASKGSIRFFQFYLILAFVSGLIHCLFCYFTEMAILPLIGASGAVSGIMAAYLKMFPGSRFYQIVLFMPLKIPVWLYMILWIGGNVFLALVAGLGSSVSWLAHLSGFGAGYLLVESFMPYGLERLRLLPDDRRV